MGGDVGDRERETERETERGRQREGDREGEGVGRWANAETHRGSRIDDRLATVVARAADDSDDQVHGAILVQVCHRHAGKVLQVLGAAAADDRRRDIGEVAIVVAGVEVHV